MNKTPSLSLLTPPDAWNKRRERAHKRFVFCSGLFVLVGVALLVVLLTTIVNKGASAFSQTYISLDIDLSPLADKANTADTANQTDLKKITTLTYARIITASLQNQINALGLGNSFSPKNIKGFVSKQAPADLRQTVLSNPALLGGRVRFETLSNGRVDRYMKGQLTRAQAKRDQKISTAQIDLADALHSAGILYTRWNWRFLSDPDASGQRPEAAGVGVAILGSFYMVLVVLIVSLPIGIATAVYLEELALKDKSQHSDFYVRTMTWITYVIEAMISNLAAVPSIVFGILGLAIFINFIGLPQSAPIVGGLVLSLMTLPTIVATTRAALRAVPPWVRLAGLALGASRLQTTVHHVLPAAMPGIMTGTIIGVSQAMGETAPLLLIGMVAFVRDYPASIIDGGLFDAASALPVQVFLWTQRSDPAFVERASGAIIVLLVFLLLFNALAAILRWRFERKW